MIFFFGLFKKGIKAISRFLYKEREIEEKYKNRTDIKIVAGGLLLSIIIIIIGLISSIFIDIIMGAIGQSTFSLATIFENFSQGGQLLLISITIDLGIALTLFIIYFTKNGYYLILKLVHDLEEKKD